MNVWVSAIDTDAGKTLATALLGRFRLLQGRSVITQKLAQTGCEGVSDDVQRHREIMGMPWTDADCAGDTCPYVFPLAASRGCMDTSLNMAGAFRSSSVNMSDGMVLKTAPAPRI